MDFVKISLQNLLEALVNIVNVILKFIGSGVIKASEAFDQFQLSGQFESVGSYFQNFAYMLLASVVLYRILKVYVVEDSSYSFSDIIVKLIITGFCIAKAPAIVSWLMEIGSKMMNEVNAISNIPIPTVETIELEDVAFLSMGKALLASGIFAIGVLLIALIGIFIVYIQAAYLTVQLIILKTVSPVLALSNMSDGNNLFFMLMKDVIGIVFTRALQLILIKFSLGLVVGAAKSFATNIVIGGIVDGVNQSVLAIAMMAGLMMIPKIFSKYIQVGQASSGGGGGGGKALSAVSSFIMGGLGL